MTETELLTSLLVAEHQSVYAYGLIGARLTGSERLAARSAFDAHRAARDRVDTALLARGAPRPGAAAGYEIPATDRASLLALAVHVEEGLSQRWLDLVGGTTQRQLRSLAVDGLRDTAVRAAGWRLTSGTTPATVAFPGR